MPTATISSAPFSYASSSATSSLVPVAGTTSYGTPSSLAARLAGRRAVAIAVDEKLRAAAQRLVGHGVHVTDDHVRLVAGLEQRVGAAVDADQDRLEVADVRPDHAQVALVAGPTRDDQRMPVAEARLQRRELDPLGEQLPFLAQVAHRVLGERLERFGDTTSLFGERPFELRLLEHAARCEAVPLR